MQTIRLMFKVLWSPSEVMFLLSKNPRVLGPVLLLCATSFITTAVVTIVYFALFSAIGREGEFKGFLSITAVACMPLVLRQLASVVSALVVPAAAITPDRLGSLSP